MWAYFWTFIKAFVVGGALCAKLLPDMIAGRIRRMLFVATGALMSTTTGNEGENIPGIAHAVAFERMEA